MNAVLSLMPPESQFTCSAMTSQSLYYAGNVDLRNKILSIAEEEGARNASYALEATAKRRQAVDRHHGQGIGNRSNDH